MADEDNSGSKGGWVNPSLQKGDTRDKMSSPSMGALSGGTALLFSRDETTKNAGLGIMSGSAALTAGLENKRALEAWNEDQLRTYEEHIATNKGFFDESRGGIDRYGNYRNTLLPLFAKDNTGIAMEGAFARNAGSVFDVANQLSPEQQIQINQSKVDGLRSSQAQADAQFAGLFSGRHERALLNDQEQVAEQRINVAFKRKSAGMQALQGTLDDIGKMQQQKGFTSTGLGKNKLQFDANRRISNQGASELGAAWGANVADVRQIKNDVLDQQMAMAGQIDDQARASLSLNNAASQAYAQRQLAATSPFDILKIGQSSFQAGAQPTPAQIPSTMSIWGNAAQNQLERALQFSGDFKSSDKNTRTSVTPQRTTTGSETWAQNAGTDSANSELWGGR